MTVGMSAPPIGITSRMPKSRASAAKTGNNQVCVGSSASVTPITTAASATAPLTIRWPGKDTGRLPISS
ncbi:hypothetical protein SPHS6_04063 [Sphingobium sp. S6]|nr:hypothetical protein SPHS6_04063 [Sphingobium sp. S6]CAD7342487.1 hypothetical protein SPHS8_04084 [Sphingobium sp. S8]